MPNETKFRPKGKKSITIDISDSEKEDEVQEIEETPEVIEQAVDEGPPEFDENGKRISYNKNGKVRKKIKCSEARLEALARGRVTRARNQALKREKDAKSQAKIEEPPIHPPELRRSNTIRSTAPPEGIDIPTPAAKAVKKMPKAKVKKIVYVQEEDSSSEEEQVVLVKKKAKKRAVVKKRREKIQESSGSESEKNDHSSVNYSNAFSDTQMRYSRMIGL